MMASVCSLLWQEIGFFEVVKVGRLCVVGAVVRFATLKSLGSSRERISAKYCAQMGTRMMHKCSFHGPLAFLMIALTYFSQLDSRAREKRCARRQSLPIIQIHIYFCFETFVGPSHNFVNSSSKRS